ncbi:GNAT family N-acetyltransferase [Chloroflexota bacterium]
MSYTVTQESFESLVSYQDNPEYGLEWSSVFVLPVWLKVWWQEFKPGDELYLSAVRHDEKVIGIAPLMVKEGRASLIGSTDVCDYLDFVVTPGAEGDFFGVLLDELRQKGINRLDLRSLRPDSTVLTCLVDIARNRGYEVICQPEDVTVELDLPSTWEEYLEILTTKQRHEVRRKLRRLPEAGKAEFYIIEDSAAIHKAMDTFLKMFTESRSDKASFMTDQKESFFRALADSMTEAGLLRLGILELDTLPTATIMYFNYNDCIYLYNSGYDPKYDYLSVGLLSKVLCIRESIQEGKKKFDFLKGNEAYKYHLGGKEIPLSNCQITIK